MDRIIKGFHKDNTGDWLADLECGHSQYLRHSPPNAIRPWVINKNERKKFIGTSLNCTDCDINNDAFNTSDEQKYEIAERVKAECFKAAVDGYEYAKISGLCHEGAWDLALDHIKSLNIKRIMKAYKK
jgi:hypothetical protein